MNFPARSLAKVEQASSLSNPSALSVWLTAFLWLTLFARFPIHAEELLPLWQLLPSDRSYLTTDNSQRGLAFNPATTNLVLVNRAGGLSVSVLDAASGAEVRTLNTDGVAGGTFALNMTDVTDDALLHASQRDESRFDGPRSRLIL
jgi:hypothetical protein